MRRTSTLFALPSFLRGMSSVLDLGSTMMVYNTSNSPEEADAKALYSDWASIGDDFNVAMIQWETEYEEEETKFVK